VVFLIAAHFAAGCHRDIEAYPDESFGATFCEEVEAEAGTLMAPMAVTSHSAASNGAYVSSGIR
jgi:hypothetical protein